MLLLGEGLDGVRVCLQTVKQLHAVVVMLLHVKRLKWNKKAQQLELLTECCCSYVGTDIKAIWFPTAVGLVARVREQDASQKSQLCD